MREKQQIMIGKPTAAVSTQTTIGMDLGDRWSRYCVVDCHGEIRIWRSSSMR